MNREPVATNENIAWNYEYPSRIIEQVVENGYIKPGDSVLDAGCGFGRNSNWLASKEVEVHAVNVNEDELNQAKKKAEKMGVTVDYIRADVTKLPFHDQSFDSIIDSGCTHQLDQAGQQRAVAEFRRVLRPGGYIIYFGFSKEHPDSKEDDPTFRDLDDVVATLGDGFKVIASSKTTWKPRPEERASFAEHRGINALFQKQEENPLK